MAGTGGAYVLSKGLAVLSTYNSSNANGVEAFRCVTITSAGKVDIAANATAPTYVVMENIDRAKVATDKAVAQVAMHGIVPVKVGVVTSITLGGRVMADATGAGTVINAATATNYALGVVVGITGTLAAGDIIEVLLTPGVHV